MIQFCTTIDGVDYLCEDCAKKLDLDSIKQLHIKNRDSLLHDIARGVKALSEKHPSAKMSCVEVVLLQGSSVVLKTDVSTVMEYLADDIYYNEESDWSNADNVVVHTI